MRFRDWTGDTVLHCHIVDHEDQGMMKNVRILGPRDPGPREGAGITTQGQAPRAASLPKLAPRFTLPDAEGRAHSLGDFVGRRTILIFFRGSGCLECAKQLQAFIELRRELLSGGVSLLAISSATAEDLRCAQHAVPSEKKTPILLLSDPQQAVFKEFGCFSDEKNEPLHGTFVVDAGGRICWRSIGPEPYMNVKRVLGIAMGADLEGLSNSPN
jgi:peroxiredoxin